MASTANGGGGSSVPKRKPVFVKVDHLKPGTNGHTLTVKVVSANAVSQQKKSRNNSQLLGKGGGVDLMKPGTTVILRNAKIDMFKGSMRLAVDKWGRVEVTEPENFVVNEDNNLSLVEYELVSVVEE
ncbi:hypothetical protein C3L33_15544, partial [Rhododendron williamsianum]